MLACRFLTTNKVGTFDEAFKSRIHISLYYKELDEQQSEEIWKVNFKLIKESRTNITFNENKLLRWVKKAWKKNDEQNLRPWNGRQIHNACQTAAALAEFDAEGKLGREHLDAVADASREFDKYLKVTHGHDDIDRAKIAGIRGDDGYNNLPLRQPATPLSQTSSGKKRSSKKRMPSPPPDSPSEYSSDSDEDDD